MEVNMASMTVEVAVVPARKPSHIVEEIFNEVSLSFLKTNSSRPTLHSENREAPLVLTSTALAVLRSLPGLLKEQRLRNRWDSGFLFVDLAQDSAVNCTYLAYLETSSDIPAIPFVGLLDQRLAGRFARSNRHPIIPDLPQKLIDNLLVEIVYESQLVSDRTDWAACCSLETVGQYAPSTDKFQQTDLIAQSLSRKFLVQYIVAEE